MQRLHWVTRHLQRSASAAVGVALFLAPGHPFAQPPADPTVSGVPPAVAFDGVDDQLQEPPVPPAPPAPAQLPTPGRPVGAPPKPLSPPLPPEPPVAGQPINVRIDLIITEQRGAEPATKKTVTVTCGDRESGSIRSESVVRGVVVPLNVDVRPTLLTDSRVKLMLSFQYGAEPGAMAGKDYGENTTIRQSLGVVLDAGKPMIVTQSADAIGDRRVTVDVKATILK